MKKILYVLLIAVTMSNGANAQKKSAGNIPAVISAAFKNKFPAAEKVKWEVESAEYEANFKLNGQEFSSTFDGTGNWLETETEIAVSTLPGSIHSTLKREFAEFKVKEASKIESVKNGDGYEAEISNGNEKFDLLFSPDGKVLSKTKIEKKD